MREGFVLLIYVLALYAGYLLPIPSIILAWLEWIETKKVPPIRVWRRTMSRVGLLLERGHAISGGMEDSAGFLVL